MSNQPSSMPSKAITGNSSQNGSNKAKQRRSTPTRYSILSDPRLSQLFALSSQLEALADSCEVAPDTHVSNESQSRPLKNKQVSPVPPPIPPKPAGMAGVITMSNSFSYKNNGNSQGLSDLRHVINGNPLPVPKLPPKKVPMNNFEEDSYLCDNPTSSKIKYHRLIDSYNSTSKDGDDYWILDNSIEYDGKQSQNDITTDLNIPNNSRQNTSISNLIPMPPVRISTVSHDSRMSTSSGNGGIHGNEDEGEGEFSTGTELDISGTNSAHSILSADYYLSPEYNPTQESTSAFPPSKPKTPKEVENKTMESSASEFEFIMAQELGYQGDYNGINDTAEATTRPAEEFINAKSEQYRWSYNADFGDDSDYGYDVNEHFPGVPMLRPPPIGRSAENGSSSDTHSQINEKFPLSSSEIKRHCPISKDTIDKNKDVITCWQTRCVELEFALQKFRDQAQTIRELLREKLSELEQRVVEAETRAEDAEDKVRVMERRFNDTDWQPSMSNGSKSNMTSSTVSDSKSFSGKNDDDYQIGPNEKDRLIRDLESEVEQQRQLRLADAKQVEAKAARIKDWVTNKLKELEEQNRHLREQNAHCNDQMGLLKDRLEQLQEMSISRKNTSRSGSHSSSIIIENSAISVVDGEHKSKGNITTPQNPKGCNGIKNRRSYQSPPICSVAHGKKDQLSSERGLTSTVDIKLGHKHVSGPINLQQTSKEIGKMEKEAKYGSVRSEPIDDPLSSVIQDLTKQITETTTSLDESGRDSKYSETGNNEENTEASVCSPDSLDICNLNNRPIPPPRTKVPAPVPISNATTEASSTVSNSVVHKQTRSESDHDLPISLAASGDIQSSKGMTYNSNNKNKHKLLLQDSLETENTVNNPSLSTEFPEKHLSLQMESLPDGFVHSDLNAKGALTKKDFYHYQQCSSGIRPAMSDEQHDYSEIYTPTGNDDERFRHPPGAASATWNHNDDTTNPVRVGNAGAGTSTTTTNTSCSNTSMSAGSSAEPRTGSGDSGLTGNLSGNSAGSRAATSCSTGGEEDPNLILNNKANILNGAPPLPLHRYPSWEGRIYQVASDAGILTSNETTSTNTLLYGTSETVSAVGDSMNNNNETLSSEIRNLEDDHAIDYEGERDINNRLSTASLRGSIGFGSDVSVPVYTSIKGRASQIRTMPFTGDSSDSESDGGGEGNVRSVSGTRLESTERSSAAKIRDAVSCGSDVSTDYVVPPDATAVVTTTACSTSAYGELLQAASPQPGACGNRASTTASGLISESPARGKGISGSGANSYGTMGSIEKALEKSGYLTKLGGKIKSWRRRYFVLKNGTLCYWKSQHDTHRKPQGLIILDDSCRISKADGANTFEIATSSGNEGNGKGKNNKNRTYYLTADTQPLMEDWVRVLQNVIQRNALQLLLRNRGNHQEGSTNITEDGAPTCTLEAWVTKVKNGHAKKVWCVLIGKMFVYFRNPSDQYPGGQINMRDARVEEVEHISSDSDSDPAESSTTGLLTHSNAINPTSTGKTPASTVGIFSNHVGNQAPTYLIFDSTADKENWLYELTLVSGGDPKAGTQFERLIQKLMEEQDVNAGNSDVWRNPLMAYSKESITTPLTTFTSDDLQAEAIKLFKSLQLFTSVVMDSAGIDYHVSLAANAFQKCLDVPELQPELLCALVKQTTPHIVPLTKHHANQGSGGGVQSFLVNATNQLFGVCDSSGAQKSTLSSPQSVEGAQVDGLLNGQATANQSSPAMGKLNSSNQSASIQSSDAQWDSKANPQYYVFMQGWMLLALGVSIFVPKSSKLLWFLRTHFARNKDERTETGKYASYCGRALERAVVNGGRTAKPSRTEVLSILLKNPHHHSLPHAVPVHCANDEYQVIGFDGSTMVSEFLSELNRQLGTRGLEQSGFTIHSDDPIDKDLDHALLMEDKVCDVISRWETALRENRCGKFENKRVIRFIYKSRLFWRKNIPGEGDRERLLLAYQVATGISNGRFPINKELALELSALMSQIHFGDLTLDAKASSKSTADAIKRFFPVRYLDCEEDTKAASTSTANDKNVKEASDDVIINDTNSIIVTSLKEKWATLKGKSSHDCVRIFLTCTRKWQFFGSKLFEVETLSESGSVNIWLAVGEEGVALLDYTTMQPTTRYPYDTIVTFGGCQDDFMLVINLFGNNEEIACQGGRRRRHLSSKGQHHNSQNASDQHTSRSSLESSGSMNAGSTSGTGGSGRECTSKLLFHANKHQILQMTLLMADYMNMMGHSRNRRNFPSGTRSKASHGINSINSGNGIHSCGPPSTPKSIGTPSRASSRGANVHHSTGHNGNPRLTAPNTPRPDRQNSQNSVGN